MTSPDVVLFHVHAPHTFLRIAHLSTCTIPDVNSLELPYQHANVRTTQAHSSQCSVELHTSSISLQHIILASYTVIHIIHGYKLTWGARWRSG